MVKDAELATRLRMTVMRLARRLRQENPAGITPSQQSVLAVLSRQGPMGVTALAEAERVKPPTVTRILGALEAQGLVVREPDPDDRRCVRVALSVEGRKLVASIRHRRDAYLAAGLSRLTPADRSTLSAAVEMLEGLLEEPET